MDMSDKVKAKVITAINAVAKDIIETDSNPTNVRFAKGVLDLVRSNYEPLFAQKRKELKTVFDKAVKHNEGVFLNEIKRLKAKQQSTREMIGQQFIDDLNALTPEW